MMSKKDMIIIQLMINVEDVKKDIANTIYHNLKGTILTNSKNTKTSIDKVNLLLDQFNQIEGKKYNWQSMEQI